VHAQPENWRKPLAYSQKCRYIIARISKTTKPIKIKIQQNIGTMKMYPLMQYYDVTTNSRWQTTYRFLGYNSAADFIQIVA